MIKQILDDSTTVLKCILKPAFFAAVAQLVLECFQRPARLRSLDTSLCERELHCRLEGELRWQHALGRGLQYRILEANHPKQHAAPLHHSPKANTQQTKTPREKTGA